MSRSKMGVLSGALCWNAAITRSRDVMCGSLVVGGVDLGVLLKLADTGLLMPCDSSQRRCALMLKCSTGWVRKFSVSSLHLPQTAALVRVWSVHMTSKPLLLLDIHHSGYFGWGVWVHHTAPEEWTAETVERLVRCPGYKMGINLGAQSYERSPELSKRIKTWLQMFPDRVFLTGGDYAQLTACVRTGESNLRQILVGLEETEGALGVRPSIWSMSEPGNFAQLPQILNELDYDGALLRVHGPGQRGSLTTTIDHGVVWWEGPDGSRIIAIPEYNEDRSDPRATCPSSMWIMTRYRNTDLPNGGYDLDDLWQWKDRMAAKGIDPVVMSKDDDHNNQPGGDNSSMTSGHLLAEDTENDSRFQWVSAEELFAELSEPAVVYTPEPERFETRVNSFCDYGYNCNVDWTIDLEAEAALRTADFMSFLSVVVGRETNAESQIAQAWKLHLAAQNHDISLKNTLELYHHLQYESEREAHVATEKLLTPLLDDIDTLSPTRNNTDSGAIVVFNPSGWRRQEYTTIALPSDILHGISLHDGESPIPWEKIDQQAELTTIGFVADVPPLGYRTYYVEPYDIEPTPSQIIRDGLSISTTDFSVRFGETGGIENLRVNGSDHSVIGLSMAALSGDVGGLSWKSAGTLTVSECHLSIIVREHGLVGNGYTYDITYRMTPGVPYIALSVCLTPLFLPGATRQELCEPERKIEFTAHLSENLTPTTCTREQPMLIGSYDSDFDPIFAAPGWVDYSGKDSGLAIFNRGAIGQRWDTERNSVGTILAMAGPQKRSQQLALYPHSGDAFAADAHRLGSDFAAPLHCVHELAHHGSLPPTRSIGEVRPNNLTLSSAFVRNGAPYIRVWETMGVSAEANVGCDGGNLALDRVRHDLRSTERETVVGAREIATFRVS
jgi:hypothetical protein